MSIRLRLTLLYSAILALTLIAFSVALYYILSLATISVVKDTLADEAKRLIDSKYVAVDPLGGDALVIGFFPVNKITAQTYVQTRSANGTLGDRTANLVDERIELPLSTDGLAAVQEGQSFAALTAVDDKPLLVYSQPVSVHNRIVGILQVGRSIAEQNRLLEAVKRILIVGSVVVTVLACGIGWILAGTALRPINRITQTARAIEMERDFSRRVDHAGPNDEIGRLATTFNAMLSALQAAYRQEEQALHAQRRFVADASHELRTPLTTIRGNIGLLQRYPPISEEDRVAVLDDMVDESERMSRLVNDLLVLARADAGRPLRSEPVAIKPLIEDLCRKARLLDAERDVRCENLLDVAAAGDEDAIRQILIILLDNALKYTPANGTITLSTGAADGQVSVSVRDTGSGIAPEALPHIFERFYRGDTARTGSGAGLGLAIAQTLATALHGMLTVESQPGHGSVFTLTLPQTRREAAPEPELIADSSRA